MKAETAVTERQQDNPAGAVLPAAAGPKERLSLLSHDLRSALTDILGGLRLIERQGLDDKVITQLDRIDAASRTLARLLEPDVVEEALGVAPLTQHRVAVGLAAFLDGIGKRWQARAAEKGLGFAIVTGDDLPEAVTLDRVTLERVTGNLISNAIKFADKGKVELRVAVEPDGALCLRVLDEGPGISPAALGSLYGYAARAGRLNKPGSGLGLFIARELAANMGATLDVHNREQGGVEAVFRIPSGGWERRPVREVAQEVIPDLTGLRILVAEDNLTNQLVVKHMLDAMGADYVMAADGREALSFLETGHFDIALLDIEMPRMTGLELIREIRAKDPPLGKMPLVALTAYAMQKHRERIAAAGADGVIAKPLLSLAGFGNEICRFLGHVPGGVERKVVANDVGRMGADDLIDRRVYDRLIETIGPEARGELLDKLGEDTRNVKMGLRAALAENDMNGIRSNTHMLVSVAGAIGASGLQGDARDLNAAARSDGADAVRMLGEKCLEGLDRLQEFILGEQADGAVPDGSRGAE